ncbi:sensor histidine kinase [Virgibacillus profundi]|uniref:histidine kinase n=1 Tax=Virgibacillus profundi TaxID=2024555 RepID=A0A2A2IJY7_9BACI|nr:sensor histidine kinase [Virgibacillus profundi]PAV31584.1 sensor histidine kinase [Virgibacillus profundi]PXY55770.1 sensor histidine kinase [Virgibacillus profundi]
MQNWFHIFPRNTGLSLYAWIIFCLLPFYFIFRSISLMEIIFGIVMIILFFTTYRLSFIKKGWTVYVSVGIQIAINVGMTLFYGYVYFSLFLAFFIGNIQNRIGFITLYIVHLVTTVGAVSVGFFTQSQIFFTQYPFIILSVIGVILLPFNMYNRNKREKLENQLENANKKISQLMVFEERQRIARDLHDTLGQKLSLIGLKSDLAGKLIDVKPDSAKNELTDINQTARTALKEVRELVSDMKGTKLKDEMLRIRQMLKAAEIDFYLEGNPELINTPLLVENVLSMCLKEAINNLVKHSQATSCHVKIQQSTDEWLIEVQDNGIGIPEKVDYLEEHGLQGMRERLEFVNGTLTIKSSNGTTLTIQIPHVIQQTYKGELS